MFGKKVYNYLLDTSKIASDKGLYLSDKWDTNNLKKCNILV